MLRRARTDQASARRGDDGDRLRGLRGVWILDLGSDDGCSSGQLDFDGEWERESARHTGERRQPRNMGQLFMVRADTETQIGRGRTGLRSTNMG